MSAPNSNGNGMIESSGSHGTVYIGGQPHTVVLAPQQPNVTAYAGQQLNWQLSMPQQTGTYVLQAPMNTTGSSSPLTMVVNHAHAPAPVTYNDPPSSESAHHGSLANQLQAYQQVAAATAGNNMVGIKRHLANDAANANANAGSKAERPASAQPAAAAGGGGSSAGNAPATSGGGRPAPAAPASKDAAPATTTAVSSRYHGVTWYKASKRWQARLCTGRRQFHLGYFRTEEEAARAYDRAMIQVQGAKATQLNFPDEAASVAASIAAGTGPAVPPALTSASTPPAGAGGASASHKSAPALGQSAPGSGSLTRRTTQAHHGGSEPNSAETAGQLMGGPMVAGGGGTLSGQRSSSGGADGSGDSQAPPLTQQQHQQLLMAQHQQWQLQYQQQLALANQQLQQQGPRPQQRLRLQLQQLQDTSMDTHDEPASTTSLPQPTPGSTDHGSSLLGGMGSGMLGSNNHPNAASFSDPLGRPLAMQLAALQSPSHGGHYQQQQPGSRNGSSGLLGLTLAAHHQQLYQQQQAGQQGQQQFMLLAPPSGSHSLSNAEPSSGNLQIYNATAGGATATQLLSPIGHLDTLAAVATGSYHEGGATTTNATPAAATVVLQASPAPQQAASAAAAPSASTGGGAAGATGGEGGMVQLVGRPAVAGILMADTGEFLPTGSTGALQLYEHEWDGSRLVLRNVLVGLVATPHQQQQQQHQQQQHQQHYASLPLSEDTHMALSRGHQGPTPPVMVLPAVPSSAPDLRGVAPSAVLAPAVAGGPSRLGTWLASGAMEMDQN